ncbi:MAG TPA: hypothetical protein PLD40_07275, partial [Kiritimatiellia bacterium]|nr:hypothetical protein [Kiritimatiellia bacterium]HPV47370.1 hypothetical protein [Kiritimatiellia bacterium]
METNPPPSDSFNEFGYRKKRPARAADDAPRGPRPFRKPYRAGRDDAPPVAEGEGQDFRRPYRPPYRDQDRPPRPYPRRDERGAHAPGGFRKPYRPRHDDGQPPRDGAGQDFRRPRREDDRPRGPGGYRKPYRPRTTEPGDQESSAGYRPRRPGGGHFRKPYGGPRSDGPGGSSGPRGGYGRPYGRPAAGEGQERGFRKPYSPRP